MKISEGHQANFEEKHSRLVHICRIDYLSKLNKIMEETLITLFCNRKDLFQSRLEELLHKCFRKKTLTQMAILTCSFLHKLELKHFQNVGAMKNHVMNLESRSSYESQQSALEIHSKNLPASNSVLACILYNSSYSEEFLDI